MSMRPRILFLDIEMPGLSGLEVAKQASGKCHIVFVTAFDSYAVAAFEQGAVDYVLKPFSPARLATSVARLRERVGGAPAPIDGVARALSKPRQPGQGVLALDHGFAGRRSAPHHGRGDLLHPGGQQVHGVVTPHQDSVIRRPIKELIEELDPRMFWQIHRGTLVNVNAIARRDARFWRTAVRQAEAAQGNAPGERVLRASVQADVSAWPR